MPGKHNAGGCGCCGCPPCSITGAWSFNTTTCILQFSAYANEDCADNEDVTIEVVDHLGTVINNNALIGTHNGWFKSYPTIGEVYTATVTGCGGTTVDYDYTVPTYTTCTQCCDDIRGLFFEINGVPSSHWSYSQTNPAGDVILTRVQYSALNGVYTQPLVSGSPCYSQTTFPETSAGVLYLDEYYWNATYPLATGCPPTIPGSGVTHIATIFDSWVVAYKPAIGARLWSVKTTVTSSIKTGSGPQSVRSGTAYDAITLRNISSGTINYALICDPLQGKLRVAGRNVDTEISGGSGSCTQVFPANYRVIPTF